MQELGDVRDRVYQVLKRIKDNKAAGPDGLPAEVWKAAGDLGVDYLTEIITDIIRSNDLPVAWRGGRLAKLFKGKGDMADCDMYRGLLVGDHSSKVFTGVFCQPVQQRINSALPPEQCGGVARSGANRGHHVVSAFVERTVMAKLYAAILFLDLTKAFDKLVREMAFHLPANATCKADIVVNLEQAGVDAVAASHLADYLLQHGGILYQTEVPEHLVELVANLHTHTWFALSPEGRIIVTKRGSRQGCRFGALIFNIVYSVALLGLRQKLGKLSVTLHAECEPSGPPWAHQPGAYPTMQVPAADVTYVDDEAILIVADTAESLNAKLSQVAAAAHETMAAHGMLLNWKPGKSEAILMWRGAGARAARADAARGERMALTLPGFPALECLIVKEYKHLGPMQSGTPSSALDVSERLRKASAAYYSLVRRVFAVPQLSIPLRLRLFQSLVLSVLLLN